MSKPNHDYFMTCDVCRNLVSRKILIPHTKEAVSETLHDKRKGPYYICRFCCGDTTVLTEYKTI